MSKVIMVRAAGDDHQVVTVKSSRRNYRKKPCKDCPWRKDAVGKFPPEAFKHSANTAYDMSQHTFGCHRSGKDRPATCAGFLLQGAENNLAVRLGIFNGTYNQDVSADGIELHASYRDMAIANGVDKDDPALSLCR